MESLLPLSVFAFVASITPGPNNIMLTFAIMIALTLYSALAICS